MASTVRVPIIEIILCASGIMSSVKRKCKTLKHDEKIRVIKAVDDGL